MLDLFALGEVLERDAVEATRKSRERANVRIDRRAAVILEEIIMNMDPIHGRAGGVHFVKERKEVVYEVG